MSHPEQQAWCRQVKEKFPELFVSKRVLDIGSLDINGSNAYLFSGCSYVGIDVVSGKNVSICDPEGMAHWFTLYPPSQLYDTIISTECLEHDLHWRDTLRTAVAILKPGGLLLTTCATTGRGEHGTNRSKPWDAPGLPWGDYYRNLTEDDFREAWAIGQWPFITHEFAIGEATRDLYFYGIKR